MKKSMCLLMLLALYSVRAASLTIESYPNLGDPGLITGTTDLDPKKYKIAEYIDVFGSIWVKPTQAQPLQAIHDDGTFSLTFITGGQDQCAQKIYLFAVTNGYNPPGILGGTSIPQEVYDKAVATAVIDRTPQGNYFDWSGYSWLKKHTGDCIWGPGPNHFDANNAFVDGNGKLHLVIRYINGAWTCGEIIMTKSVGYGIYRFHIDSDLSNFPGEIIAGWFTYDDDPAYAHREIDHEFSNGAAIGKDAPWQYVIQPYNVENQRFRYSATQGNPAILSFTWSLGIVSFSTHTDPATAFSGRYAFGYELQWNEYIGSSAWFDVAHFMINTTDRKSYTYHEDDTTWYLMRAFRTSLRARVESTEPVAYLDWTMTAGVPPVGNERVHLNAWLLNGAAPGDGNVTSEYEVVVSKFEFTPLPTAATPATLQMDLHDFSNSYDSTFTKATIDVTVKKN